MSVNVTTVTVNNKLGNQFGNPVVKVITSPNQNDTGDLTIPAGDEMMVYPLDQSAKATSLQLEYIEIEVLGQGNEIPIPIGIDSTDDLNVGVIYVSGQNKWTIIFNPIGIKGGDSNVNVTIGQDQPDKKYVSSYSFMFGMAGGILFGPLLYGISPILWGVAVGVALVGAVAAWYKSARRKKKNRKEDPGK